MTSALENLISRRSCRAYFDTQIEKQQLDDILEAGKYAPTGRGLQTPIMVVVQNKEMLQRLERMNAAVMGNADAHTFYGAPSLIIVFANASSPLGVSDANLVIGNLLNGANAVGVDSCYIWRAKEAFESEEGKRLKAQWGIPDEYEGAGNVILGYGKEEGKREAAARKADYVKCID